MNSCSGDNTERTSREHGYGGGSQTQDRQPSIRYAAVRDEWVDEAERGMESALQAKPLDVREQYERQIKELQEAYGKAMFELRARKKLASMLGEEEK